MVEVGELHTNHKRKNHRKYKIKKELQKTQCQQICIKNKYASENDKIYELN